MRRLNVLFLVLFAGIFAWVLFLRPDTVAVIQRGAMRVFSPFIEASGKAEDMARSVGVRAPDRETLRTRLEEATRERDRLRLEVRQLDELVRENNALRRQLDYAERSSLELVPARVIGRKPETWYRTVIIDKGTDSGIRVDYPVIVPVGDDAGLVGKIAELRGGNTAVVLLLTDEICQVAARLDGTQEQGIVSGERGALRSIPNLHLRYLSKEAKPEAGQKVITSGAGEIFPPNLLVGAVTESRVGSIDAEATVRPGVDFNGLTNVFVILPDVSGNVSRIPMGEAVEENGESPSREAETGAGRAEPVASDTPAEEASAIEPSAQDAGAVDEPAVDEPAQNPPSEEEPARTRPAPSPGTDPGAR